MKLSGKKIISDDAKEILNELKEDKHSESKKKFMKNAMQEAKSISKKRSK